MLEVMKRREPTARINPACHLIKSSTVSIQVKDGNVLLKGSVDLLRVLRHGVRIKEEVDDAIDKVCFS